MNNAFWDFSLATYAKPGVADCCIRAQDDLGVDVNMLLYASWLAALGQQMTGDHLAALMAELSGWQAQVVKPLRALRRSLEPVAGASELYQGLKVLELQAEQQQQDVMWRYYSAAQALPTGASLESNLAMLPELARAQAATRRQLTVCLAGAIRQ